METLKLSWEWRFFYYLGLEQDVTGYFLKKL